MEVFKVEEREMIFEGSDVRGVDGRKFVQVIEVRDEYCRERVEMWNGVIEFNGSCINMSFFFLVIW